VDKIQYVSEKNCLCCGSCTWQTIYKRPNVYIHTQKGKHKLSLNYAICHNCGYVYQNPRANDNFYKYFYKNQYRIAITNEGKNRLQKKENQFNYIWKFVADNNTKKVFDIGAFNGNFLSFFKKNGWQVDGNDLSQNGCKMAKKLFNIKLHNNDFCDEICQDNSQDLITIIQVLEHIPNPAEMIKKIKRKLKKTGYLFIEVPNLKYASTDNLSDFFGFQHISYFEEKSLQQLLTKQGFSLIDSSLAEDNSLRIVAKKSNKQTTQKTTNAHSQNLKYIQKYKEQRHKIENKISGKISKNINKNLIIYGAGEHTDQLFELLKTKNIKPNPIYILDSNPAKQNTQYLNLPVKSPQNINLKPNETIIISSYSYQEAIYNYLLKQNINKKQIIKLYD